MPGWWAPSPDAEQLVACYAVDPELLSPDPQGYARMGAHRAAFLMQSLQDLDHSLQSLGQTLHLYVGKPEAVLERVMAQVPLSCISFGVEDTHEEIVQEHAMSTWAHRHGLRVRQYRSRTLFDREAVLNLFPRIPAVFSEFRKRVERYLEVPRAIPSPSTLPPPVDGLQCDKAEVYAMLQKHAAGAQVRFVGGETEGLKRLQYYLWESDLLASYKETRNEMLGDDYSSKFSPWLAWGCLSARTIAHAITEYEEERTKNQSTYWLLFELIWRDFFRFTASAGGIGMFRKSGLRGVSVFSRPNKFQLNAWKEGNTGIPMIDANMREMLASGFMSNRGRQNVASFLVKDLQQDWREGAAWFEHMLIDYDVCSNYGNWQYVAGVGNDPREDRYFNILSQAERYDPQGRYVRTHVPELLAVPDALVHRPDLWKKQGIKAYVSPLVDAGKWVRR